VDEKVFTQLRAPDNAPEDKFMVLRYFVKAEVQIAKPGSEPPKQEMREDERLANIEFMFAVDYRCNFNEPPSAESLGAFTKNVVFHMWPYWREAVHAECARMRLPAITIPMLKPGQQLTFLQGAVPAGPPRELEKQAD
jgi:hypothetical protein